MTKLFSLKSLAFAGAAAFALTLAAAPQADAAEKLTLNVSNLGYVSVLEGDTQLTQTEDGKVIYYQLAKDENAVKDGKYTAITDENLGYYNLSKFAGKAKYLSISPDGTKDAATGVAIKAAPKVKAKYSAKDGLTMTIDSKEAKITSEAGIDLIATADGKEYAVNGINANLIKSTSVLGGTIEITVREIAATDGIASESKVAKVKIPGKAKAPKVSLKLNVAKAFTWKIGDKLEYRLATDTVSTAAGKWAAGAKDAKTWAAVVEAGIDKATADAIVTGDAITTDLTISVRTKATDKKPASAINVVKLKKSAASPTASAVTVTTKANAKGVTEASIKAEADIQYSLNGGEKWNKLGEGKEKNLKATVTAEKGLLVRFAGDAKKVILPSLVTEFSVDNKTGVVAGTAYDYATDGKLTTVNATAK